MVQYPEDSIVNNMNHNRWYIWMISSPGLCLKGLRFKSWPEDCHN